MPFLEVHNFPTTGNLANPMDFWAGVDGQGFDRQLFMSLGGRPGDGRGAGIYAHDDRRGDAHWVKEFEDGDAETANKLRDWTDAAGLRRLYCWIEGPGAGQSCLLYRDLGSTAWSFESLSFAGNAVGGRGLGVRYDGAADLFHAQANNWGTTKDGLARRKDRTTLAWSTHRTGSPGLPWELEFEAGGLLWEFWNDFGGAATPATYRNGVSVTNPPSADISQAAWFPGSGHLYVIGELGAGNQDVYRYVAGTWVSVLTLSSAARGDHVVAVPRGAGELWVVGHSPLQVYRSFNGTTWADMGLPTIASGSDSNHLTALGYYCSRVWVAVRDAPAGLIRIYRETLPSRCAGGMLQIA